MNNKTNSRIYWKKRVITIEPVIDRIMRVVLSIISKSLSYQFQNKQWYTLGHLTNLSYLRHNECFVFISTKDPKTFESQYWKETILIANKKIVKEQKTSIVILHFLRLSKTLINTNVSIWGRSHNHETRRGHRLLIHRLLQGIDEIICFVVLTRSTQLQNLWHQRRENNKKYLVRCKDGSRQRFIVLYSLEILIALRTVRGVACERLLLQIIRRSPDVHITVFGWRDDVLVIITIWGRKKTKKMYLKVAASCLLLLVWPLYLWSKLKLSMPNWIKANSDN